MEPDLTLTQEERRALASLRRLAKRWPERLWLFSASGALMVMLVDERGEQAMTDPNHGGVDPRYIVDEIDGIPNDGGDW